MNLDKKKFKRLFVDNINKMKVLIVLDNNTDDIELAQYRKESK